MRYLGLDLGTRTLGISISSGIIASVYDTIRHNEEYDMLAVKVHDIVQKEKIDKIILGYPKNMNNTIGPAAQRVLDFKEKLEKLLPIEVILEDERLTSVVANNTLISADISRNKRKKKVDGVASVIILSAYLDRKVN